MTGLFGVQKLSALLDAGTGAPSTPFDAGVGALSAVLDAGASVEFARPAVLAAVPVAAVVLWVLVVRPSDAAADATPDDGTASTGAEARRASTGNEGEDGGEGATTPAEAAPRRVRLALFGTRLLVVACLVAAAAGPATVTTATTPGDPEVTMLVDRSASTGVYAPVADEVEAGVEEAGVPVDRVAVATGNESRIGDGVLANLRPNGSVLVVSDGQVTGGASLSRAAAVARSVNATVNRVRLDRNRSDVRVSVSGPRTASVGVESRFAVRVAGVEGPPVDARVAVSVDGEEVASRGVPDDGSFAVTHNFTEVGPHRITARITDAGSAGDGSSGDGSAGDGSSGDGSAGDGSSGDGSAGDGGPRDDASGDAFAVNDVSRKTVQVVDRPEVLYVSRGDYALESYLRELYDVTRAESIPDDLDDYYAVVVHDVAAPDLGNVTALQDHVVGGGGLVAVGGEHAYGDGDYGNSRISSLLPVTVGDDGGGERSRIALAVDVSGSAAGGMAVQKALALDVLAQLGDRNEVGVVAYNHAAHRVANLSSLGANREALERRIRSLRSGGGTQVHAGLMGASQLLGEAGGTVILLGDGRTAREPALAAADRLADDGVRVVTVGVGNVNERVLRGVAERTDGTFLLADETNRLRVEFGGPDRRYRGEHAVVVDAGHFVTRGVEPTASLPGVNGVRVKDGADLLVATGYGAPAVSAWRFGLGRAVSVTAYGAGGGLGGLLSEPDSLLLSRSVNWAIGDPRRKATGVVAAPDTRLGEPTTVVYAGQDPPVDADLSFAAVGPERYEAEVVPDDLGYRSVAGSAFAVDYPREYAALGVAPELERAVERTGGRAFDPGETGAIASAVERQATRERRVRQSWDWAALLAGLAVLVVEICARRLRRRRGTGVIP